MGRLAPKAHYRRNLHHYFQRKGAYFLTFNLSGAIPREIRALRIQQLAERRNAGEDRRWFGQLEAFLHQPKGPIWLSDASVAASVQGEFHRFDDILYQLICYTLMPNHVHMIIIPRETTPAGKPISLALITHTIKQRSARQANLILNRTGAFWQHESFDRFIRSTHEYHRTVAYILNNPIKAGLVNQWDEWPWTYIKGSEPRSQEPKR